MMTTLYGVVAGNLIFKPIAMKFEQRTQQRVAVMMTVMQGVILLRQNRSPAVIRETLESYSAERHDEILEGDGSPQPSVAQ